MARSEVHSGRHHRHPDRAVRDVRPPLVWWANKLPWIEFDGFTPVLADGWLDTYRVQILPFVASAFSIYLFYQYFSSIPTELDEAARVDGAGWFRIYRSVIMPLSGRPSQRLPSSPSCRPGTPISGRSWSSNRKNSDRS